jgi:hypothetical protein
MKPGVITSLRFCFTFFGLDERYGDVTSIDKRLTARLRSSTYAEYALPLISLFDLSPLPVVAKVPPPIGSKRAVYTPFLSNLCYLMIENACRHDHGGAI